MRKKRELCHSEKELVFKWKTEGVLQKDIAKRIRVSESTISFVLKNSINCTPVSKKHLCGRKKVLTDKEINVVKEIIDNDR